MQTGLDVIGWIAAIITIGMYIPQTYKVIKTRNVEGLSKITFLMVAGGSFFWTWFGVANHNWQAWAANAIALFLMLPIIFFLFKSKTVALSSDASKVNFIKQYFKAHKLFLISSIIVLINFVATVVLLALGQTIASPAALIFSIFGGLGISLPFLPQTIKTIKTKNISAISIYSTIAIITANTFWTIFYILLNIHFGFDAGNLMGALFSAIGIIISVSLAFVYFRYKK